MHWYRYKRIGVWGAFLGFSHRDVSCVSHDGILYSHCAHRLYINLLCDYEKRLNIFDKFADQISIVVLRLCVIDDEHKIGIKTNNVKSTK